MGKGFILFEGERLIPKFEEDMHVMNSLGSDPLKLSRFRT